MSGGRQTDGSPVQQKEEKSENGKNQYARIFLLLSTSKLVFRLLLRRRRSFLCALVSRYVCAPVRVFFNGGEFFSSESKSKKKREKAEGCKKASCTRFLWPLPFGIWGSFLIKKEEIST